MSADMPEWLAQVARRHGMEDQPDIDPLDPEASAPTWPGPQKPPQDGLRTA